MILDTHVANAFPLDARESLASYGGFVVSASYEPDRGQVGARTVLQRTSYALVVDYAETDRGRERDSAQLLALVKQHSDDTVLATWPLNDIDVGTRELRDWLGQVRGPLLIDMTTLTKPYLFVLLKLASRLGIEHIDFLYTEPERYNWEAGKGTWILTEGRTAVAYLPGYRLPGATGTRRVEAARTLLILNGGFEGLRSAEVVDRLAPQHVIFLYGYPAFRPGWDDAAIVAHEDIVHAEECIAHVPAPAHDPFRTAQVVIAHYRQHTHSYDSIVAAPLGSKPQALGVALAHFVEPSLEVMYHFPSMYRAQSSFGARRTFLYRVSLPPVGT